MLTRRRLTWSALGVLPLLLGLTTAELRAQPPGATNGEYILRAPAARIEGIASRHGLTVVRRIEGRDVFVVRKTAQLSISGVDTTATTPDTTTSPTRDEAELLADPDVQSVELNGIVSTPEVSSPLSLNGSVVSILDGLSDTRLTNYFDTQAWVRYVDQPATAAIGLAESHTAAGGGAGIVAVIDTGVDPHHPVLAGALVPGYDFIHETDGIPSEWTDVDGSLVSILDGSVVSILDGQAVTLNGSVVAILDRATATTLNPSLLPRAFGHGTMVAGLVHLVAPTARIMPLKAFTADGTSTVFDVVRAIYFAVDHGAHVINMSFSAATASAEITHAINDATNRGVICVASAGNLGQETIVYPGGLRNVVGVGSTSSTTPATRSPFSNYGDALVSLGAPGEGVITTYPGAHFAAAWGTSFSAPLAAGGAALLVQVDPALDQSEAADLLGKAQPMSSGMGKGRLSLPDAVRSAADKTPPTVSLTSPAGGGSLFGSVLVSASASDNVAVAGVKFLLDGNPLGPEITSAPFEQMWTTTAASNGSHVLTAIARDRSGNQTSSVSSVTVLNDTAAPSVTLTSPSGGVSVSDTVRVTAAASDDLEVMGVRFSVDGTPLGVEEASAPYEAVWTTTTLANGPHVVSAVAHDAAGHETTTSVVVTVRNDLQAPTVALTTPVQGATVGGIVSVLAAASDDVGVVSVQFLVDGIVAGSALTAAPFEWLWNTAAIANGPHTVAAVARDAAAHETTTSLVVTVANDHAVPTVALLNPTAGATLIGTVSLVAAAFDDIGVASVQFLIDGVAVGGAITADPYELSWNTADLTNGEHTVTAAARDAAGHETATSVVVTAANLGT